MEDAGELAYGSTHFPLHQLAGRLARAGDGHFAVYTCAMALRSMVIYLCWILRDEVHGNCLVYLKLQMFAHPLVLFCFSGVFQVEPNSLSDIF
jgi:hypothetical protein